MEKDNPNSTAKLSDFGYKQQLERSLTLKDLIIYGLIFMVPIAPFGIYGSVVSSSQGMIALTYLIGMVAMFFTAISYGQMSQASQSLDLFTPMLNVELIKVSVFSPVG